VQQGREVEITNSFELALSDDGTEVNQQFFTDRQSQCEDALRLVTIVYADSLLSLVKQVFPTFEFREHGSMH
jgi:hypothetical protein